MLAYTTFRGSQFSHGRRPNNWIGRNFSSNEYPENEKMLEAKLYLRSIAGMEISCKIHEKLAHATERHKGKPTKEECPTEIRCVLLELDEIAVAECIARLEGGASL